jgi:hypothetical protein
MLRRLHGLGVPVAPDRALAQQPVCGQPSARQYERCPPRQAEEDGGGGEPADHADKTAGDEIHRVRERRAGHAKVEIARHDHVHRELRIFEVGDSRRPYARVRQPVIQIGGRLVTQAMADRRLQRRQDLEQHERNPGQRQRQPQRLATLDRGDQRPHRYGEDGRQHAVQRHDGPPRERQPPAGPRQHGEEHPFLALTEALQHTSLRRLYYVPRSAMTGHECYHCKQWIEQGQAHDCWTTTEAALTNDLSEDLRDAWERIRETAVELGDQRIYASHNSIMFARKVCYFFVRPQRKYLEVWFFVGRAIKSPLIDKVMQGSSTKTAHRVRITHRDQVEPPLSGWLREAYDWSMAPVRRKTTNAAKAAKATRLRQGSGGQAKATKKKAVTSKHPPAGRRVVTTTRTASKRARPKR